MDGRIKNGGALIGAGRPVGSRSYTTVEREAMMLQMRGRTLDNMHMLYNSQLTLAKGCTYLFKIEKERRTGQKGKVYYVSKPPKLVTSLDEITRYLENVIEEENNEINYTENPEEYLAPEKEFDEGATYYFITTEKPNNVAIDSMLDRTFGQSVKSVELTGKDGVPLNEPSDDALLKDVANKINEIHSGTSVGSNGIVAYTLDIETSDKK